MAAEEGGAVVLVALRIATGQTEGEGGRRRGNRVAGRSEAVQEMDQVLGVLAGSIEADEEVHGAALLGQVVEALSQEGVAGRRLGEL